MLGFEKYGVWEAEQNLPGGETSCRGSPACVEHASARFVGEKAWDLIINFYRILVDYTMAVKVVLNIEYA